MPSTTTATSKVKKPKVALSHNDYLVLLNALDHYGAKYPNVPRHVAQTSRLEEAISEAHSSGWSSQPMDGPIKIVLTIDQWVPYPS